MAFCFVIHLKRGDRPTCHNKHVSSVSSHRLNTEHLSQPNEGGDSERDPGWDELIILLYSQWRTNEAIHDQMLHQEKRNHWLSYAGSLDMSSSISMLVYLSSLVLCLLTLLLREQMLHPDLLSLTEFLLQDLGQTALCSLLFLQWHPFTSKL